MSWLQNMSVPPRTHVELRPRAVAGRRIVLKLDAAVRFGIAWRRPGQAPRALTASTGNHTGAGPLEPWAILCLLDILSRGLGGARAAAAVKSAARDVDAERVIAALEERAATLDLRGAAVARPFRHWIRPGEPTHDLALTLVLLSKTTGRVFVAAKRPALESIRPEPIELTWPRIRWPKARPDAEGRP